MAINTINKKLSLISLLKPWETPVPISSDGLGWDDKQHLIWGYAGIYWGTTIELLMAGTITAVSGVSGRMRLAGVASGIDEGVVNEFHFPDIPPDLDPDVKRIFEELRTTLEQQLIGDFYIGGDIHVDGDLHLGGEQV